MTRWGGEGGGRKVRSLWESLCSPLSENEKTNNRTRPGVIADGMVVLADSLLLEPDIVCLRDELWFAGWMRLPRYPSTSPVLPTADFFSHLLRYICIFLFFFFFLLYFRLGIHVRQVAASMPGDCVR